MKEIYPEICGMLMRFTRALHKISVGAVGGLGIHPSEHFLLMGLNRLGCALSQSQLAEKLDVSPASVARTLKNLDAGGFIERNESEGDCRRNEIRITEKGSVVLEKSIRMFGSIDERIYDGFSDSELDALHGMLSRMLDNISALEQDEKAREELSTI